MGASYRETRRIPKHVLRGDTYNPQGRPATTRQVVAPTVLLAAAQRSNGV